MVISCASRKGAERTLESTARYLENVLKLKVNREKTCISRIGGIKFLGYGFYFDTKAKEWNFRLHEKSEAKLKAKIKEITQRSNGWSVAYRQAKLSQLVRGWVAYFKLARCKGTLEGIDQWLRRRIRMLYWKMWKRIRTRYKSLMKLGVGKQKAYEWANSRCNCLVAPCLLSIYIHYRHISKFLGFDSTFSRGGLQGPSLCVSEGSG